MCACVCVCVRACVYLCASVYVSDSLSVCLYACVTLHHLTMLMVTGLEIVKTCCPVICLNKLINNQLITILSVQIFCM